MYEYKNKIFNMDCLAGMAMLPDSSVDMVLTDLPYGTTAGAWDILIPFDHLWAELHRVAKPNAAMVFTAAPHISLPARRSASYAKAGSPF